MEETASIVEDAEAPLGLEVAYEPLLEPGDGNGPVRDTREREAGVLAVQVFVEADLLAA